MACFRPETAAKVSAAGSMRRLKADLIFKSALPSYFAISLSLPVVLVAFYTSYLKSMPFGGYLCRMLFPTAGLALLYGLGQVLRDSALWCP